MLTINQVRGYWVRGGYWQFTEDIRNGVITSTEVDLSNCSFEERLEILEVVDNLHRHIICKNIDAFTEEILYKNSYSELMGGTYFHDFKIAVPEKTKDLERQLASYVKTTASVPWYKRWRSAFVDWILVCIILFLLAFVGVKEELLSNPFSYISSLYTESRK